MKCDDYLTMLATLPVEELAYGRAREHAVGCQDCDRVTRVVAEREHNMLMAFEELDSAVPPAETAASALVRSRRRKVALFYQLGLGLAMAATVVFIMVTRLTSSPPSDPMISETFHLQCLSPEQAAEVLRPRLDPAARIAFRPNSQLGVIDVEASREELANARSLLERYDNPAASQCAAQVLVPRVP